MLITMPDRGLRRRCNKCAAPFYDLGRATIVCPKCGAAYVPARRRATPAGNDVIVEARKPAKESPAPADPVGHDADDDDSDDTVDDEADAEASAHDDDDVVPADNDAQTA